MKKQEMPVGVRVRGYALLNEFGQIEFTPEQKGAHAGRKKIVKQTDEYTITETKEHLLVYMRAKKGKTRLENVMKMSQTFNQVLFAIKDYEF